MRLPRMEMYVHPSEQKIRKIKWSATFPRPILFSDEPASALAAGDDGATERINDKNKR